MTRLQAISRLSDMVAAGEYPELTDAQLGTLVDDTARWSTYVVNTAYAVGDIVRPTTANGRQYRCIVAGTSDPTTEPDWLTGPKGATYGDETDDDLLWEDDGATSAEMYDLRKAAYRGWLLKSAAVAGLSDSSDGSESMRMSQLSAQCMAMARRYRGGGIY